MLAVIIPVVLLITISAVKKIPKIGGNLLLAFILSSLVALFMGGVYNPLEWVMPFIDGLNRVGFIIMILVFGAIFSMQQIETGAMQTVLNVLRAIFGHTAQGLVLAVLIALYLGGAMLGTVAAVGAVVGMLIVPALDDMGLSPELICATIVTGGSMGAIMPPISNAVNVAAGLVGTDVMPVIQISYITVGVGLVLTSAFFCKVYVGNRYRVPEHLIPKETAGQILKKQWKTLIPMAILITLVLLASIPALKWDLPAMALKLIPMGESNFYDTVKGIKVIGGLMNNIVLSLIVSIAVSFALYKPLRQDGWKKTVKSVNSVIGIVYIQFGAAFFLGAFSAGGQMPLIAEWASGLDANFLKIGGSLTLMLAGMIMGSQSSSQTLLVPILAPAWLAIGVQPIDASVAAAHLAAAGQGLPPADLNTFIIAGLVGSILHKKVDPLKSMYYTIPYCVYLAIVGLVFLYL